jgi:hypothetical protein
LIVNNSMFFEIDPNFLIGLEVLCYHDFTDDQEVSDTSVAFYPQVRDKFIIYIYLELDDVTGVAGDFYNNKHIEKI